MTLFKCQNLCWFFIILLVHVIVGIGSFVTMATGYFLFVFGFASNILLYLFAFFILFFTNLDGIFYTIWTIIVLIINIVYIGWIMAIFYNEPSKDSKKFFIFLGICVLIPQIVDMLLLNDNLRIYLLLPVHLTCFMSFLYRDRDLKL